MAQQLTDGVSTASANEESTELFGWLMPKIKEWRQYRDDNHKAMWDKYYRIWRGIWAAEDKIRNSERSRLISPATQQAVEGAVAEMEEATFGRDIWFDLVEDVDDPNPHDIEAYRTLLKEDLEKEKVKRNICEAMLNGALYGNGIGEIITEEKEELVPEDQPIGNTGLRSRGVKRRKYLCVRLNPVSPYNFSSDPAVQDINDGLGCEVTEIVPEHQVTASIKAGEYEDVDYGQYTQSSTFQLPGENKTIPATGKLKLTRYYGLAPRAYLLDWENEKRKKESDEEEEGYEPESDLIEAIIVVVNDSCIVKAKQNPYMMQDRSIVAYQHDTVPERFHGRGICEKGYNPQVALDTELRARADALALTTHPMMGIDASRLPRGSKPTVQPGQSILTNGNPKDILMPMNFGQLNPVSYKESAELERMVTMGTGTMDSAAPLGINPRNTTLGGMSMMQAASIKRQKRTLMNFNEGFLEPFITKALWRFMQFDPKRYPVKDFKFKAASTMGIMARELEIQNLTTLMGYIGPNSPYTKPLLTAVVEHSSFSRREDIIKQIEQAKPPQGPTPEQQTAQGQLKVQLDNNTLQAQRLQFDQQKQAKADQQRDREISQKDEELRIRKAELLKEAMLKEKELNQNHDNAAAQTLIRAHDAHHSALGDAAKAAESVHAVNAADNGVKALAQSQQQTAKAVESLAKELKPRAKVIKIKSPVTGKIYEGTVN